MEDPKVEETYRVDRSRLSDIISKIDKAYIDTEGSRIILTKDGIDIYAKVGVILHGCIGRLVSGANINHIHYETYLQTYSGTDVVKPNLVDVLREFII